MTTKPSSSDPKAGKTMSTGDQQSTSNATKSSKRGKKFVSIRNVLGGRKRKKRTKSDRTMGGSDNEDDNVVTTIPTTATAGTSSSSSNSEQQLPRVSTPTRDLTNMATDDDDIHGKLSPSSVGTTETVSSVEELPSRFDPPGSLSPSFRQFDRPIPSRRRTTGGASRSSSKSGVKERNMVKLAKRYGEVAEELRHKNAEIEKLSMSQAVLKAKVENMKEQERWYKSHISQLIKGQAAFQANLESVNLSSDRDQQSEIENIFRYHENLTMEIHQKHAKKYKELQMDLQEELAHIEGGCVALTDDEKTDEDDDKTDDDISVTDLEKETTTRDHLDVLAKKKESAAKGAKEGSWGWSVLCFGLLLVAGVASTLKFSKPLLSLRDTWGGVLPSIDKATTSLPSEFLTATKAVVDESLALFLNSSVEVVVPTEKESSDLSTTVTRIIPKEEEGEEKVELFFNAVAVPEEMFFPAYGEDNMYEEDMWNTFGQRPNMSPPFHDLF